ncbi:uncharacterized protein LOC114755378 [Neltuma alba]|uniref:uncharacterized protein LOC114755378 n=1 Tax=Neltuma alba TaxID=207710 RepID=UPI0010A542A4|nr:uncharacterized protein LOC114755378 [Prosopis alba]
MDRSWINALRTSDEYEHGVDQFLEFTKNNVPNNNGLFYYPCVKCMNGLRQVTTEIKDHLICFGFYKAYRQWVLHGESKKHKVCQIEKDDMDMDERVEDMIHDVGVDVVEQLHKYSNLCNDAEKPLYPGYMLPEGNILPDRNYEAKKILCPMGLGYKKIHACPNDCVLYRKAYDELDACPVCGTSRYKVKKMEGGDVITKGPPAKPGNDIDVYLAPLIDDLKMMWEVGIDIFDAYHEESFKLRAMIFCIINDFPAYGNLSGYSVKGHNACPICEDRTSHQQLSHGKKTIYLGHRRFLERGHPYRRKKKEFNGFQEYRDPPEPLTADQVYERVKDIDTVLGKSQKRVTEKNLWKKKSIFFDLPY